LRYGITSGFGIPSIHNIAIYEALRHAPAFHHWIVRHEQAAGFVADAFFRASGRPAAVFASTGPGNLFTLVPLLESLQTNTPVLLIGTNVATPFLDKHCNALHETPRQRDIFAPLTRFSVRVNGPDEIPAAMAAAAAVLNGPAPGPVFVEIPHDVLLAPVSADFPMEERKSAAKPGENELAEAVRQIETRQRPVVLVGSGVKPDAAASVQRLIEALHAPFVTTTSGKGLIADDHPLSMGCMSRLGTVQEMLLQSDLLISFGARITEFDTGRFSLKLPAAHLHIADDPGYFAGMFPASLQVTGAVSTIASELAGKIRPRRIWWNTAVARTAERERLDGLQADGYRALSALRSALGRGDIVVNDQSILNYWASAFFPVLEPRTFLYPSGSGTLGYGLPAAIGAACAMRRAADPRKVVCVAGDGGFQYTAHELATLAQYDLPVKVLLVNDKKYGIIGFLQRAAFGHTHEVDLKNPDFCRLAEAHGIHAERATTLEGLTEKLRAWLDAPGPALLEWQIELKSPWEAGAIQRPAMPSDRKEDKKEPTQPR
jgi:thiamine pyrophosphate-dependent acetolactate synthase large subunit-like protein